MTVFRNLNYQRREYEATDIVACEAKAPPNDNYVSCGADILEPLTLLFKENGVKYWGYL